MGLGGLQDNLVDGRARQAIETPPCGLALLAVFIRGHLGQNHDLILAAEAFQGM